MAVWAAGIRAIQAKAAADRIAVISLLAGGFFLDGEGPIGCPVPGLELFKAYAERLLEMTAARQDDDDFFAHGSFPSMICDWRR